MELLSFCSLLWILSLVSGTPTPWHDPSSSSQSWPKPEYQSMQPPPGSNKAGSVVHLILVPEEDTNEQEMAEEEERSQGYESDDQDSSKDMTEINQYYMQPPTRPQTMQKPAPRPMPYEMFSQTVQQPESKPAPQPMPQYELSYGQQMPMSKSRKQPDSEPQAIMHPIPLPMNTQYEISYRMPPMSPSNQEPQPLSHYEVSYGQAMPQPQSQPQQKQRQQSMSQQRYQPQAMSQSKFGMLYGKPPRMTSQDGMMVSQYQRNSQSSSQQSSPEMIPIQIEAPWYSTQRQMQTEMAEKNVPQQKPMTLVAYTYNQPQPSQQMQTNPSEKKSQNGKSSSVPFVPAIIIGYQREPETSQSSNKMSMSELMSKMQLPKGERMRKPWQYVASRQPQPKSQYPSSKHASSTWMPMSMMTSKKPAQDNGDPQQKSQPQHPSWEKYMIDPTPPLPADRPIPPHRQLNGNGNIPTIWIGQVPNSSDGKSQSGYQQMSPMNGQMKSTPPRKSPGPKWTKVESDNNNVDVYLKVIN